MNLHDFSYDLPQELIAQDPLEDRSSSRLMLLDKNTGAIEHKIFKDIIDYLNPGDCLVLNNTKVIPARLMGVREGTGASIEVLLLSAERTMSGRFLLNRERRQDRETGLYLARESLPLRCSMWLRTETGL